MKLPKVDFDFFQEAISQAKPEEADAIMRAYNSDMYVQGLYGLGVAVRNQVEKYRQEIADIDAENDQPLKRGESFHD